MTEQKSCRSKIVSLSRKTSLLRRQSVRRQKKKELFKMKVYFVKSTSSKTGIQLLLIYTILMLKRCFLKIYVRAT